MDPVQQLVNKAQELKNEERLVEAAHCYKDILDLLSKEATEHARSVEGTRVDEDTTRKIMPSYFIEVQKYLKRDRIYALVANNLGVIYARLGDSESAKKLFEEAIELTPDGDKYEDPKTNLANIAPK
jgi:tetratricopeptide (TPR) repeat protein